MKSKSANSILEAVHDTARALHDAGLINQNRMQEYDALCLKPSEKDREHSEALLQELVAQAQEHNMGY